MGNGLPFSSRSIRRSSPISVIFGSQQDRSSRRHSWESIVRLLLGNEHHSPQIHSDELGGAMTAHSIRGGPAPRPSRRIVGIIQGRRRPYDGKRFPPLPTPPPEKQVKVVEAYRGEKTPPFAYANRRGRNREEANTMRESNEL